MIHNESSSCLSQTSADEVTATPGRRNGVMMPSRVNIYDALKSLTKHSAASAAAKMFFSGHPRHDEGENQNVRC